MNDWHVLGLGGDPTPGDPAQTHALAARVLDQAALAEHNASRLQSVAATGGDLRMEGDYAPKFQQVLGELPTELTKLSTAYRGCGDALAAYAASLEEAKTKAGAALRRGEDATLRYQGALRELRSLLPPDRQVMVSSGLGLHEFSLYSATMGLDPGAKAQVEILARRARSAEDDRDLARRLASQAAQLRGDAERRCADGIHQALGDSGIKDKTWWQKAWDTVSEPFRSWDDFVELCKKVALVAGVVALFISGPIGWALVAAALVAGAVVYADTLVKFARGEASLLDVALAALYLLPGQAGVIKLAGLGRATLGLVRNLPATGKTAVATLRGNDRATTEIRAGVPNLRQSAVTVEKRLCVKDPIDVATGEMVLQQTDVELAGMLPLVLRRTHVSSYRVGRWFGSTWASTLDQRLEVDPTGVFYAAEDGMLLLYPLPAAGASVLPEEGPRWPLHRTEDGTYTITVPDRGNTLQFANAGMPDGGVLPLTAINDRNGHRIDLVHDAEGALTEVRHSGGYRIGVDTSGWTITALHLLDDDHDSRQLLVRYGYDAAGRLVEVVNSSGLPLRFDYDLQGRMTSWQDRNGTWYRYISDPDGRCVHTSGSDGCLDGDLAYDPDKQVTLVTDSLGHVTRFELNDAVQIVREVDPLGNTTAYESDRYDRPLSRTDPLGRTTRYAYDDAGNLAEVSQPDGSQTTVVYNDLRLPVTVTGPDGASWRRAYDQRGNLTALTDPSGATTTYAYDERGHLTAATNALGHTSQVETDAAGLPLALTDPLGAVTRYARDRFGRVVAVTDPMGATTGFEWTVEGRRASRTLADGTTERWAYDPEGNLIEHIDALGQSTRIEVTHFDLPAARIGPDGARLVFAYDTELRLVAVTNPQGLIWRYDYDPAGTLVQETDFNGRVLAYAHDAAGQLVRRTNGMGETTHYRHDLLGNIVEQRSGDTIATFEHDPAGRLVRAANPDAELVFDRDPLGRVLAETCNGRTVYSSYDALGRRVRRRTPSGVESVWEYDASDQPVALHTAGRTMRFAYDGAGREVERHLAGDAALFQTWDAAARLISQAIITSEKSLGGVESARAARAIQRRSYGYRADGHLTSVDDQLLGARTFDLDAVGRVTAVRSAGWTERYAYDAAGNITNTAWPSPAPARSPDHDAQGQREYAGTLIRRAGQVRYQHDQQGRVALRQQRRLSAKPRTWRYSWDAADRLTAVTTPDGQEWRYRYDPLGRRIAKQQLTNDNTTVAEQVDFTWDGLVLAEQTATNWLPDGGEPAARRTIVWEWEVDSFRPVSQTERSSLREAPQDQIDERFYAIVTDLVGTPTELVDPEGSVVWQLRTSHWGTLLSASGARADCPFRFPGQYFDAETQLHYSYFRYYDPTDGRYQSTDPIGLDGGPNPHTYVSNPASWIDPLGLVPYKSAARAPGTGVVRDFAHGTSAGNAEAILAGGLNEAAARHLSAGGRYARPGAFHTFEVSPINHEGLQLAYEMGLRHGHDSVVLVCRLPASTVDDLTAAGLVRVESIPSVSLPQTAFLPGAFERINRDAVWQLVKPGG